MNSTKENIQAQLLLTGNELMSGVTVDTNSVRFAKALDEIGISIERRVTIGDDMDVLIKELREQSQACDLLIVNGGLGPTLDDLSAEALGKAFDLPIEQHPEAYEHVSTWCERIKTPLNDANLKQCMLPKGVNILANPIGSAVGFSIIKNDCVILFTPGVPYELEVMFEASIIPLLQSAFPNTKNPFIDRLHFFGIGESGFQQKVDDEITDWPNNVELSFRAGTPTVEVKITTFDPSHQADKDYCRKRLMDLFGDFYIAEGENTLASAMVSLLKEKGLSITFAESCTGGKIASMITEVAGASEVFNAGFVTYSNEIKHSMLGVENQLLIDHGAVSEPVAMQMLEGALKNSGADYGIAVSGIAGPGGGSEEKPVGTVCIAWGNLQKKQVRTLLMPRSRSMFQLMVAATGLDLVRRQILGIDSEPRYFGRTLFKK